jgi:hypothetical protein
MKVLAIHDAQGNIAGVVASPGDAPLGAVVVPGQTMTEVEVPDMQIDPADPESYQQFIEMLKQFRVEVKTEGRLVKKAPDKAD